MLIVNRKDLRCSGTKPWVLGYSLESIMLRLRSHVTLPLARYKGEEEEREWPGQYYVCFYTETLCLSTFYNMAHFSSLSCCALYTIPGPVTVPNTFYYAYLFLWPSLRIHSLKGLSSLPLDL